MNLSKSSNKCTLLIGGKERTIKFSMGTNEMYMSEYVKHQVFNELAEIMFLLYCGLVIGDKKLVVLPNGETEIAKSELPENFSFEMAKVWIDNCEDERLEEASKFAEEAMGFISEAVLLQHSRTLKQAEAMGVNYTEILKNSPLTLS